MTLTDGDHVRNVLGRYCDLMGWCFTERMFLVDQTGDLSRHLGGGLP